MNFYEEAQEKLRRELPGITGNKEGAIKTAVRDALLNFAGQELSHGGATAGQARAGEHRADPRVPERRVRERRRKGGRAAFDTVQVVFGRVARVGQRREPEGQGRRADPGKR